MHKNALWNALSTLLTPVHIEDIQQSHYYDHPYPLHCQGPWTVLDPELEGV